MHKVNSTSLLEVGYDKKLKVLKIKFRDGSIYDYFGIPEKLYLDLMNASSKSQFVQEFIYEKFRSKEVR